MKEKHNREIKHMHLHLLKNGHRAKMYPVDCTIHIYRFYLQLLHSPITSKNPSKKNSHNTFPSRFQYRITYKIFLSGDT